MLSRNKTLTALAAVCVFGLAAAANAYDTCYPCSRPVVVQPTVVRTAPACTTCTSSRTDLPGYYADAYNYSTTSESSDITYVIPTQHGFVESTHNNLPPSNPVDQYYATHQVINGRVVDTSRGSAMASAPAPVTTAVRPTAARTVTPTAPAVIPATTSSAIQPWVSSPMVQNRRLSSQVQPLNPQLHVTPPAAHSGLSLPGRPVERPVDVIDIIDIAEIY